MTNGKQRVREILERLYWAGFQAHKASLDPRNSKGIRAIEEKSQGEALDSIEEVIKEVLGEDFVFDRPKEDYIPNTYIHLKAKNELRSEQLGRWESK